MSKKNEYRCDSCSKIFGHSTRAMRYCDLCGVELEEGYNSIIGLASGRDICFGCYSVITAAIRLGFDAEVKEYKVCYHYGSYTGIFGDKYAYHHCTRCPIGVMINKPEGGKWHIRWPGISEQAANEGVPITAEIVACPFCGEELM